MIAIAKTTVLIQFNDDDRDTRECEIRRIGRKHYLLDLSTEWEFEQRQPGWPGVCSGLWLGGKTTAHVERAVEPLGFHVID